MRTTIPAVCCCVLLASLTATADQPPAEDLAVYRLSLWVANSQVQRATIDALKDYAEGFELLEAFIRKRAASENAPYAVKALWAFWKSPRFEERLVRLRTAVLGSSALKLGKVKKEPAQQLTITREGAKVVEVMVALPATPKRQTAMALTRLLFEHNPRKYSGEMIAVLRDRLARDKMSLFDSTPKELLELLPHVKAEQLYPLVPSLIENLDAFFPEARQGAYTCLVLITREAFAFCADGSAEERRQAMDRYRELYEKKLKPRQ